MPNTMQAVLLAVALLGLAIKPAMSSPSDLQASEQGRAIAAARKALAAATSTRGPTDPQTLQAMSTLVSAYLDAEDFEAAAPLAHDVLAGLARTTPRDDTAIALVTSDLAQIAEGRGRLTYAESQYQRSLDLAERASVKNYAAIAQALNNFGAFLNNVGRSREAEPLLRKALHLRERYLGPTAPLTAQSLCLLGVSALMQEDLLLAESLLRQSLAIRQQMDPPSRRSDIAESQEMLAKLLIATGRPDEALKLASEAFDNDVAGFGPTHLRTLMAMHLKADTLAATAHEAESDRLHRDLLAKIESLTPPQLEILAGMLGDYGRHLVSAGQTARAVDVHRRAVSVSGQLQGDKENVSIRQRRYLAESLYLNGETAEAVRQGRDIVTTLGKSDPQSLDTGAALVSLAKYLLASDGTEEAREMLNRAIAILEKAAGRSSVPTLQALYLLGMSYISTDELKEAERVVEDAMGRFKDDPDIRSTAVIGDIIGLRATVYRKTGRLKEAQEAEQAARKIHADQRR